MSALVGAPITYIPKSPFVGEPLYPTTNAHSYRALDITQWELARPSVAFKETSAAMDFASWIPDYKTPEIPARPLIGKRDVHIYSSPRGSSQTVDSVGVYPDGQAQRRKSLMVSSYDRAFQQPASFVQKSVAKKNFKFNVIAEHRS